MAEEISTKRIYDERSTVDAPHATPEMAKLIHDMCFYMQNKKVRELHLLRRQIRHRVFRIRDAIIRGQQPDPEHDSGLRAWVELQFQPGMSWYKHDAQERVVGGFTFEWDVSAKEPLKVIVPFEWDGHFDGDFAAEKKICVPPAFTKQG